MRKSRFTENQIIAIFKESEAGIRAKDVCRKHGISEATQGNSWSKYGGMYAEMTLHRPALDRLRTTPGC